VLLVAITILAYNLSPPSVINGKLSGVELQAFFHNVYGLISSFFVIAIFWVLYTKILDYITDADDVVILTSLVFFILVLLIPVFSLAQFQYRNLQSVISLALLQITNGSLLLLLWTYLLKRRKKLMSNQEELSVNDNRYMYGRIALIPCTYLIAILTGYFVSIQVAGIFPVIIVPAVISLARVFGSMNDKMESTNF
jgi:uncharacterized membrane protein